MKRKRKPWTKDEFDLLGKLPDAEVADLSGRTFGTVWQKRRALSIDPLALRFRKWTPAEDKLVGTAPDADIARRLSSPIVGCRPALNHQPSTKTWHRFCFF